MIGRSRVQAPRPDSEAPADRKISTGRRRASVHDPDRLLAQVLASIPPGARADAERIEDARALLRRDPAAWGRARAVVLCASGDARDPAAWWQVRCRLRCCRGCAEVHARELRDRVVARAAGYAAPVAVLVTCPSRSLTDLPAALGELRRGLATLRRRAWWARGCAAGALVIECPLTSDRHRWAVHAHGVLGAVDASPEWRARAAREWRGVVGMPGAELSLEPLRDAGSIAGYAAKVGRDKSWSPDPRELEPWLRAHLDRAIRGRRLLVAWGRRSE